jgi:hypothetical protein
MIWFPKIEALHSIPLPQSYLNYGVSRASFGFVLIGVGVLGVLALLAYLFVNWDEKKWDEQDEKNKGSENESLR